MSQKFLSDITLSNLSSGILKVDADGKVVKAVAGTDYVDTATIGSLDALSDVSVTSPTADQILVYGQPLGGDPGVNIWYNKTPSFLTSASSIGALGDVTIGTTAVGQLLSWNGSAWVNWSPNYLTSYTETDPIYTGSSWYTTINNSSNWDTAYGWGNHAGLYSLTSHTHNVFTQATSETVGGEEVIIPGSNGFVPASGFDDTGKFLRADGTWQTVTTDLTGYATETWVGQQGYLTSLPSHDHDDRYYTETESDNRFVSYENVNRTVPPSGGWYRLAKIARGGARIAISYTGGSNSPHTFVIDAYKNWSSDASIKVEKYGAANYITAVRIIQAPDGGNDDYYIEALFADLSSTEHQIACYYQELLGYTALSEVFRVSAYLELLATSSEEGDTPIEIVSVGGEGVYTQNGGFSGNLSVGGTISTTTGSSSNWDTAYGWGNHASAGYLTYIPTPVNGDWWNGGSVVVATDGVMEMGKYMDFHTSDSGGNADFDLRVTVSPGIFSVGGEIEATGGNSTQWNTAYGWGNHASQGYLTSYENNYISDVRVEESNLVFTGQGSAFSQSVDLSALPFQAQGNYLTAESDTLDTVVTRGNSTDSNIRVKRPSNKVDNNGNPIEFGGRVEFNNDFVSGQSGYMAFRYPTYNNFLIGGDYDGNIGGAIPNIQFGRSNGSVYMHIAAQNGSGNIGIGTTNPLAKLHVVGNTYIDSGVLYTDTIAGYSAGIISLAANTNFTVPSGIITVAKDLGTNDYANVGQHNMQLRIRKASLDDGCAPRALELGVLDNGTAIIQANHCGIGYNTLSLNPVAGQVLINGNIAATEYWVQAQGYLTSETDSQELEWNQAEKLLTISNGNTVDLSQMASVSDIEDAGFITAESDTLATVTGRGATTANAITVGGATINGIWQTTISTEGGWSKLSFVASNAWGDGTTYGVLGAGGGAEPGVMTYNQHATWVGESSGAGVRMGRSGGVASGAWYQVATMGGDEFMIAKNAQWSNGGLKITAGGELQHGSGNKLWHAGNDGSGSGLDADLLDGNHASSFLRSDAYNSNYGGLQVHRNIGTIDGSWPDSEHTFGLENSDAGNIVINFHRAGYTSNNLWYNGSKFRFDQSLEVQGVVTATGGNSTNWNTAYGWGNHATANYWVTSNPDPQIVAAGSVTFQYDVEIQGQLLETSSIRVKENIVDLEPVGDKVSKLRPVRYNKIGTDVQEIGLIAEEVAELFPEVVHYNEEGEAESLNYTRLSVLLLQTVKELSDRIQKLENK